VTSAILASTSSIMSVDVMRVESIGRVFMRPTTRLTLSLFWKRKKKQFSELLITRGQYYKLYGRLHVIPGLNCLMRK
jgi:hypothetical protein